VVHKKAVGFGYDVIFIITMHVFCKTNAALSEDYFCNMK